MMPDRLTSPTVGLMPTSAVDRRRADDRAVGLGADADAPRGWPRWPRRCPSSSRTGCGRARTGSSSGRRGRSSRSTTSSSGSWPTRSGSSCRGSPRRPRAAARRRTRPAAAIDPSSASEPAVVIIRSAVSMLSLIRTGMPCSGPRGPLRLALGVERVGDRPRLGIDLDDRAQRRTGAIDLLDPLEVELDELPRRVPARLHPLLQLLDRHLVELERRRRRLRGRSHGRRSTRTATDNTDNTDRCTETRRRVAARSRRAAIDRQPHSAAHAAETSTSHRPSGKTRQVWRSRRRGGRRSRATCARRAWRRRRARRRRGARPGRAPTTRRARPSDAG